MFRIAALFVLGLTLFSATTAFAQDATPTAEAPTGHITELAVVAFAATTGGKLQLDKTVIDAKAPEGRVISGPIVFWVESGAVVVRLLGPAEVTHANGTSTKASAGEVTLTAGDAMSIPATTTFALPRNDTEQPAVIISAIIIPG